MDVFTGHGPHGEATQFRLLPKPTLFQSHTAQLLVAEAGDQEVELGQQGEQQIAAVVRVQSLQGHQLTALVAETGGGGRDQPLLDGLPDPDGRALPQGDANDGLRLRALQRRLRREGHADRPPEPKQQPFGQGQFPQPTRQQQGVEAHRLEVQPAAAAQRLRFDLSQATAQQPLAKAQCLRALLGLLDPAQGPQFHHPSARQQGVNGGADLLGLRLLQQTFSRQLQQPAAG